MGFEILVHKYSRNYLPMKIGSTAIRCLWVSKNGIMYCRLVNCGKPSNGVCCDFIMEYVRGNRCRDRFQLIHAQGNALKMGHLMHQWAVH